MKTRTGFVSNSSSSSFTIPLSLLTSEQIAQAKNYYQVALKMTVPANEKDPEGYRLWLGTDGKPIEGSDYECRGTYLDQWWDVCERDGFICGNTSMDNFDFEEFLVRLGVPRNAIRMEKD